MPQCATLVAVRRLLSILLLAVFCLPLLAPLVARAQGAEDGVPACCRKSGRHHCMLTVDERGKVVNGNRIVRAPMTCCPMATLAVAPMPRGARMLPSAADVLYASLATQPLGTVQTECKRLISEERCRQKRGPPQQA